MWPRLGPTGRRSRVAAGEELRQSSPTSRYDSEELVKTDVGCRLEGRKKTTNGDRLQNSALRSVPDFALYFYTVPRAVRVASRLAVLYCIRWRAGDCP